MLSENEIKAIVEPLVGTLPNMGAIMGKLKVYPGMDMKVASKLVKELM